MLLDEGGRPLNDATFTQILSTPDGYIAVGWEPNLGTVIVRGSLDGSKWVRLDAEPMFASWNEGIAIGPAGWVAVQRVDRPDGSGVGSVLWYSDDGAVWQELEDQAALGNSFPGPLAAGPWGFAMTGQAEDDSGSPSPATWVSRDGRAWSRVPPSPEFVPDRAVVLRSAAVGIDSDTGRVAATADGLAWGVQVEGRLRPPTPGGFDMAIAAPGPRDDQLLLLTADAGGLTLRVGGVTAHASGVAIEWLDTLRFGGAAATTVTTGALGSVLLGYDLRTLEPRIWRSLDGLHWEETDLARGTFGGGVPALVAVGSSTVVVLGTRGSEGGDIRTQPWISREGGSWSRLESDVLGVLPDPPFDACPSKPPRSAADFIAMTDAYPSKPGAVWPLCFEDRELTIEGWVTGCGGCGGASQYVGSPSWLLDPLGYAAFWLDGETALAATGGGRLAVQIDPAHSVKAPRTGSHVRVTGHFDDRVSQACRLIPQPGVIAPLPPASLAIAICRQQFVARAIELLDR